MYVLCICACIDACVRTTYSLKKVCKEYPHKFRMILVDTNRFLLYVFSSSKFSYVWKSFMTKFTLIFPNIHQLIEDKVAKNVLTFADDRHTGA